MKNNTFPACRQAGRPAETALTICTGFLLLFLVFELQWMIYVSVTLGIVSIFSVWARNKIDWLWMKLAEALGFTSSKILLTVIYYLILFPIAMMARLQKGDFLQLKSKKEGNSYFHERNHTYQPADLEKMW